MAIVSKSDFVGIWLISLNGVNDSYINGIIDYVEKTYLRRLLGDDLYIAFTTGLAATTVESKWLNLRDGENYTYNDFNYVFSGVKTMLKYLIWVEYHDKSREMSKPTGLAIPSIENAEVITNADMSIVLARHYNIAVECYYETIDYINRKNDPTEIYANLDTTFINYMTW